MPRCARWLERGRSRSTRCAASRASARRSWRPTAPTSSAWSRRLLRRALELAAEFLRHLLAQLGGRLNDRREILEHFVRPAGVDQPARIPGRAFRQPRVERSAPGAADDVDVLGRIAARAHRPDYFL